MQLTQLFLLGVERIIAVSSISNGWIEDNNVDKDIVWDYIPLYMYKDKDAYVRSQKPKEIQAKFLPYK